ncbi:DUF4307 domain-containing protein [Streptomyces sp. NPDC019890]|uniref:DUF4307 domain-containing protein n=1 Tax=Streptomyces sp. NPDC019890 TaxID=3365064 RepID=UPI00384E45B9
MTALRDDVPTGRYGSSADESADRKLKIVGACLGAVFLGVIGWFGYDYIAGQQISAEVIKFEVTSDTEVQVHLEVRKDADATGTCTLRSRAENGDEVARLDVPVGQRGETRIDQVVKVRTKARATSAELVECTAH